MATERTFEYEPCYVISVAARLVGVHAQTLRYYERVGPCDALSLGGKQRLYSPKDIERLRRIKALTEDMGVNLAGVEVVLKLTEHILQMEKEIARLSEEVKRLRLASGTGGGGGPSQS